MNIGVVIGYLLSTFIFELHARTWHILLVHVVLLVLALLISLAFLRTRRLSDSSTMNLCRKIVRPITDTHELIIDLKKNSLLISFLMLLLSLFFYELYRMGSSSIVYLYLHRLGFDDVLYAAFFTIEQLATCIALLCLAILRNRWKINDLYLCIFGLCLSLISPMLFAFAERNRKLIFAGRSHPPNLDERD